MCEGNAGCGRDPIDLVLFVRIRMQVWVAIRGPTLQQAPCRFTVSNLKLVHFYSTF